MNEADLLILMKSPVFAGFSAEQTEAAARLLSCRTAEYGKGREIFRQGQIINRAGVVLSGSVIAQSVAFDGTVRTISRLGAAELFGDVLMSGSVPTPVSVIARQDTRVLFFGLREMIASTGNALGAQVMMNLMHTISDKFWELNRKIAYISADSMQKKIAMFLLDCEKEYNARTFTVRYSREEMASLLCTNRSALSRELSRMQAQGMISYYKSSFKIEDRHGLATLLS